MIWQDPVDYGYISYEYDTSMLERDELTSEAKKLTCRACKVGLMFLSRTIIVYRS